MLLKVKHVFLLNDMGIINVCIVVILKHLANWFQPFSSLYILNLSSSYFKIFFDNLTYNSCNLVPFLLFCRMELASFSVTPLGATTKSSYFVITCEHSNNFLLKCNTNYLMEIYRLQKTVIDQYFFPTIYWNFHM